MITRTHTRTHTHITFADPYIDCGRCGQPVDGYHDGSRCGCGGTDRWWNVPCECGTGGTVNLCPSWGPVDGCTCMEAWGRVDHRGPSPKDAR